MSVIARVTASVAVFTRKTVGISNPPMQVGGTRIWQWLDLALGSDHIDAVYANEIDVSVGVSQTILLNAFTDPDGEAVVMRQLKVLHVMLVEGTAKLAILSSATLFSDSNGVDMDNLVAGDCIHVVRSQGIEVDEETGTLILQATGTGSIRVRVIALGLQAGR